MKDKDLKEEFDKEIEKEKELEEAEIEQGQAKVKKNSKFLSFLNGVAVGVFIYALVKNKFLPLKYELMAIGLVGLFAIIGILVKKKPLKLLMTILILAIAFVLFYGQSKIDQLFRRKDHVTQTMSFIVLKESEIKTKKDAKGKSFSYASNINKELWDDFKEKEANEYKVMDDLSIFTDLEDQVKSLYKGNEDVMLFDEANRARVEEIFKDFSEKTRVLGSYEYNVKEKENENEGAVNITKEPFTVLISGIDTTGPVSTVSRTDVNVLMLVNPKEKRILLVSIPRDAYLPVREFGGAKDKLTHTGLKGIKSTENTLSDYFGIDVNYYVKVNFTSVWNIIDIIGNIDVYSHYTFTGYEGSHFEKGMNNLNSKQALEFARTRKTVEGGDYTRGVHQMEIIKATINKILSPSGILQLGSIVNEVSKNLDTDMSSDEVSKLISYQLDTGTGWKIDQMQLDGRGKTGHYSYLIPDQNIYVMEPDEDSKNEIKAAMDKILEK